MTDPSPSWFDGIQVLVMIASPILGGIGILVVEWLRPILFQKEEEKTELQKELDIAYERMIDVAQRAFEAAEDYYDTDQANLARPARIESFIGASEFELHLLFEEIYKLDPVTKNMVGDALDAYSKALTAGQFSVSERLANPGHLAVLAYSHREFRHQARLQRNKLKRSAYVDGN